MNKPENTAAELAANFHVEELEPRLENAWDYDGEAEKPREPVDNNG